MKTLYLDLLSGISGDMLVGAFIDLGVELADLERELVKLGVAGYHLHAVRTQRAHIQGIKFDVHLDRSLPPGDSEHRHEYETEHPHTHPHAHGHEHPSCSGTELGPAEKPPLALGAEPAPTTPSSAEDHGRSFADIKQLIASSPLSDWVKGKAIAVFERIAIAEGKIHGRPTEDVHFHEVGALDSIVDIVGACVALEKLGKPRVLAGPVVEGSGWVHCSHGRLPLPTPATLSILGARGIALTQCEEPQELVTPTGAGILAEFVESFGRMSGLVATRIGYGFGSRELSDRPNMLRAVLSEIPAAAGDWDTDTVAILETNLDDVSGEILGHFVERALLAGALDVFYTPVQMKKCRPGVLLTVLCREANQDELTQLIVCETGTLGVRRGLMERRKLQRDTGIVRTPYGEVAIKIGRLNGQIVQAKPEFESCKKAALQAGIPLPRLYAAANREIELLLARPSTTSPVPL